MKKTRTPCAARTRAHILSLVIPAHAGIRYAAASRLEHSRLWNTGSPVESDDDSGEQDAAPGPHGEEHREAVRLGP